MKILLLGGTGTLSTAVCLYALSKDNNVFVFNRGNNNGKLPKGVHFFIGSFYNEKDLQKCITENFYDVVIDFLSRVPSDIARVYPIFRDHCKQFLFISSACVYRREPEDFPISENSPKPNNSWDYNVEKYECENTLKSLSKDSSSFYTIVRPYITYSDERIPLGIAPSIRYHKTIIERFKSGKPWFTWDNGRALTTVTYVDEFAKGVVGLFLNERAINEDFHITGDFSYTQNELIRITKFATDSNSIVVNIPSKTIGNILPEYNSMLMGDRALDATFCNKKIKEAVNGLSFNVTYEEGIQKIIKYWNKQKPLYDYKFEARIDRMLAKVGVKTKFVMYPGAERKSRLIYFIFRYFPIIIANKLVRWI